MKTEYGNVLTSEESVLRRCKDYFKELMNAENEREKEDGWRIVSESGNAED